MIDYSKFDAAPAPQGIRAEPVVCIETEPEDADLSGWDGPGWYFWDEAYQLHGPFGTKEEASSAFSTYCAQFGGEK
jgi:hypothetical protein